MKKKFILLFLFFLLMILFIQTKYVMAKDYSIPSVCINVVINKDGSVVFDEDRTFSFNGNFTFGYYDLPKKGYESIEEFFVYENGKPYFYAENKEEGSYYIEDMGDKYRVHFFYNATDEERTFTFKYKLRGVVKVYRDYGEFYWKLQGTGWDKEIGHFEAKINFLTPIPKDEYLVWAHGPLWGEIKKANDKTVILTVDEVPPNTFVEARILIPSNYFIGVNIIDEDIKDRVLNEEEVWAKKANLIRLKDKISLYLSLLGLVLLIVLFIYLYFKYGKEYKLPKNYIYYREPPSDIPPAVVGSLLSFGGFNKNFIKATIMDLIHRKIIEIEEVKNGRRRDYLLKYKDKDKPTSKFEEILLNDILFDNKNEILMSSLKKKFKKRKNHYYNVMMDFKDSIKEEADKYSFYDKKSEKISNNMLAFGVLIGVASILLSILLTPLFMLWLLAIPLYFIGGMFALRRRSIKGKEEFDKWISFKKFLKDFSNLKEYGPKSIVLWEKYLVYATVLGVAKKVIKAIKILLPQLEDVENGTFLTAMALNQDMAFAKSLNSFDRSLSSLSHYVTKTASSKSSSGSGGGGGFSSGGGGGGGGSGGGMG